MEAAAPALRRPCEGTLQILRYNLPLYAATGAGCLAAALAAAFLPLPRPLARLAAAGAAGAALWSAASLAASYWIYDRSRLNRWDWLGERLVSPPRRWAQIHAGLDETRGALARLFPQASGEVLDVYDPAEMTEPSIARARRLTPPSVPPARPADFRALPLGDASCDAVFLVFAAHELRRPAARRRLFREVARALAPGGRAILVEHLRDRANFLAFGPGFLHFLSRGEWLGAAGGAGLAMVEELRITPFVAVLTLEKRP